LPSFPVLLTNGYIKRILDLLAPLLEVLLAIAPVPICALTLGQTKINQYTSFLSWRVKKIGWLNVAMYDAMFVYSLDCGEERMEVDAHLRHFHIAKVLSKVMMLKIWKNSNDLVVVTESCYKRTDVGRVSKVI